MGFQTNFYGQQKPYLGYVVGVLWCQPIKLIQVVSTSEFRGTTLILFFLSPPLVAGPQKYKHKIGHKYFTFQHPKKLGAFFNH